MQKDLPSFDYNTRYVSSSPRALLPDFATYWLRALLFSQTSTCRRSPDRGGVRGLLGGHSHQRGMDGPIRHDSEGGQLGHRAFSSSASYVLARVSADCCSHPLQVNYKALPAPGTVTRQSSVSPHDDPRTEDIYIFYEEIVNPSSSAPNPTYPRLTNKTSSAQVPVEYQSRLVSTKKSFGLFSPKRYKKSSNGPDTVGGRSKRDKEEDFESSVLRGRPTKMLSLTSRSHQPTSRAPYPTYDDSATRTPGHLSPSRALFSTPGRKDGVRPSRSAGELKAGDKRALSPVPMQKVTSKKEAKRIQGISPFDPNEMEFEMRMASSEVDGTLRRKAHGREPSRDDLWIGTCPNLPSQSTDHSS